MAFNSFLEAGFLEGVVAFNATVFILHIWIDFRQQRALREGKLHPAVAHLYTPDELEKKRSYNLAKMRYSVVHSTWDFALNTAFLLCGWLPFTWALAGSLLARHAPAGGALSGEAAQSVMWVLLQAGASLLLGLPWSAYSTFVLEARHGFNKTSPHTFVTDTLKSVLLGLLLIPPLVAAFTAILSRSSPYVGLYLWAFLLALSIFMMVVYPVAIAPLFNKFTPLQEGSLRSAIEGLAGSLSFPLKKLFVVDGSRHSTHSNAYMYGFGSNKRVVLYDTLLVQCNEEQVVSVLAHELGHWKLRHMPKLLVSHHAVSLAQLTLFTLVRSLPSVFESFGFPPGVTPALAGFILFQQLIGPVDEVLSLLNNLVSRRFEFQADGFAQSLGKAEPLKQSLLVLDKENKGAVATDPLYSAWHLTHPPLSERLSALDAAAKKAE